jgi:hypothetical protein
LQDLAENACEMESLARQIHPTHCIFASLRMTTGFGVCFKLLLRNV